MFEKGERYSTFDRIVRVGSHTGVNRLHDRIDEHFIACNHRDSVFRKHLGRCFLTVDEKTDYIPMWDLDIKSRVNKERNYSKIDWVTEEKYERKVTDYIREAFSFVVIPNLTEEQLRCRLEKGLIATLAQAPEKISSTKWFGLNHPDHKVKASKLWNLKHLKDPTLTDKEFATILSCLK